MIYLNHYLVIDYFHLKNNSVHFYSLTNIINLMDLYIFYFKVEEITRFKLKYIKKITNI
jgi:hypothetical protein